LIQLDPAEMVQDDDQRARHLQVALGAVAFLAQAALHLHRRGDVGERAHHRARGPGGRRDRPRQQRQPLLACRRRAPQQRAGAAGVVHRPRDRVVLARHRAPIALGDLAVAEKRCGEPMQLACLEAQDRERRGIPGHGAQTGVRDDDALLQALDDRAAQLLGGQRIRVGASIP